MGFSDAKVEDVIREKRLRLTEDVELFAGAAPMEPGPILSFFLGEPSHRAIYIGTETARREFIIAPFLLIAGQRATEAGHPVVLFSGKSLGTAAGNYSGITDFLISRGKIVTYIEAPILAVVEAKDDRIIDGIGQCVAQMVAARDFNAAQEKTEPIFGSVTNGVDWLFMRLEGDDLRRQRGIITLTDPARLFGILVAIASGTAG